MHTCIHYTKAIEPHHEKNGFLHNAKTKAQISCAVTEQLIGAFVNKIAQLIGAFVFATRIVQFLYYL